MVNIMKSDLKIRIISAVIALAIVIPILIIGGYAFYIGACVIGMIGFYELLSLKDKEKKLPLLIKLISALCFLLLTLTSLNTNTLEIDFKYFAIIFISLLMPLLSNGKRKEYIESDAFYLIGIILFLGIAFRYLIVFRNINIHYILYLMIITIMTDTFAHFFGTKLGKVKLCPDVSPNKTVEGMMGGTFFGTFIGSVYYVTFINTNMNMFYILLISLALSLVAQVGDLVFSAIKRKYGVKDYGNIMPGHGGVLDRLDSLIFALLMFSIIFEYLLIW